MSGYVSIILRIFVTLILIFVLCKSVDLRKVTVFVKEINYLWTVGAFGLIVAVRVLMALRWQYVLASQNISVSIKELIRIIFVSMFIGSVLPGTVGADVMRGYQLVRNHGQVANITSTLILDRFIGIYSLFFLAFIGGLIAETIRESTGMIYHLTVFLVVFVSGWLLICRFSTRVGSIRIFNNTKYHYIWSKLLLILSSITNVQKLKRIFLKMFTISLIVQFFRCAIFYCLYQSFGNAMSFVYFVIFIPLMFVVLILPISIGGLGVREGTLVYFFGTMGVVDEVSISVGIMFHVLQIFISLPVFILWIFNKRCFKT